MKQQPTRQGKKGQAAMTATKLKARGIFFDLDGTIVDSTEAYLEAAKTAFEAMGQEPPVARAALEIPRRMELKQPINDIVKGDPKKFLGLYLKTYYASTTEKTKPIPGVKDALKALSSKAKLALITMRRVPRQTVTAELESFGVAQYFAHVITALDTRKPKPSPEALIKAVQAIDVQICDCLMVGDSVSDVRAGKAAGVGTVAVLSGLFSCEELAREKPDLILKDAAKLPSHVE
jgi:HAD superfamily hydrolase (TIGR01509 family)